MAESIKPKIIKIQKSMTNFTTEYSLQYSPKVICKCAKLCLDQQKNFKIVEPFALSNFISIKDNYKRRSDCLFNETAVSSESCFNGENELYRTVLNDECNSTIEECPSKLSQKSYFCLLKDNLLNSKPSDRQKMIQDFNNLLKLDSTNLVYWLKQLNSSIFCNFLLDVNARWTSSNE